MILANPLRDRAFIADRPASPRWFHRRLPYYATTPLREMPDIAARFGLRHIFVKDESERLGLPAFKMLGASWACYRALAERQGHAPGDWKSIETLRGIFASMRPLTLAAATDGNHGRAVARMAALLGFASRIFVPANTAAARITAIRGEGAEVIISSGGYDQAVSEAAATADARTLVISDTSWPGYEAIPAWVIEGYATIFEELDEQLPAPPDLIIVPVGVGALAATAAKHYRTADGQTQLASVEPDSAACVMASARAGEIVTLAGEQNSIMAGLNCGTPSPLAWPAVSAGFDWLLTVSDAEVVTAMRTLHQAGITAGECGAAPLAALAAMAGTPGCLAPNSTVVLLSTEGVTDPVFYAREVAGKV
jgi:diaminopropionate ammonia-lyase